MAKEVKSRIPNGLNNSETRFYVAQFDEETGDYWGLHALQEDGSWRIFHETLDDAIAAAIVDFSIGEYIHCIYEVSRKGMKRHEFDGEAASRRPVTDFADNEDFGSW